MLKHLFLLVTKFLGAAKGLTLLRPLSQSKYDEQIGRSKSLCDCLSLHWDQENCQPFPSNAQRLPEKPKLGSWLLNLFKPNMWYVLFEKKSTLKLHRTSKKDTSTWQKKHPTTVGYLFQTLSCQNMTIFYPFQELSFQILSCQNMKILLSFSGNIFSDIVLSEHEDLIILFRKYHFSDIVLS